MIAFAKPSLSRYLASFCLGMGKGACMQARGARWKQPNWWYPIRDGEATPYLLLNLLILLTLLRLLTMLQSLWALDISSPSESRSAYKCQVWLLAELTFSIFWLAKVWKKSLYLCLNRSLERIRFRRVTNLAFSRRPAWCPPSSLPVPGAALPNEFGKQRKQKNRTTCER